MKHYKRYLALICAMLLAVCVFTGCSATANTKAAYDTAASTPEESYWIEDAAQEAPAAAESWGESVQFRRKKQNERIDKQFFP